MDRAPVERETVQVPRALSGLPVREPLLALELAAGHQLAVGLSAPYLARASAIRSGDPMKTLPSGAA
jgi:hypothetical protein